MEELSGSDEYTRWTVSLDEDLRYQPCKNHFQCHVQFDGGCRESEYEYRIENETVFIRLVNQYVEQLGPGGPELFWQIRDGVVQAQPSFDEDDIADFKQLLEWSKLKPTRWPGLTNLILTNTSVKG